MATRALIGYIENGVLTTTYNHYDGYPSNLGKALEKFYNTPEKAKEIANRGYVSYIDPETGEIEAANTGKPDTLNLNRMDPEQATEEVAALVDSYGGDYGYFYNPTSMGWEHIQNNGIRSMMGPLESILFSDMGSEEELDEVATVSSQETFNKVLNQALYQLQAKPSMGVEKWKESLANDIRLNGIEQYADFTADDFLEDYDNYVMDTDLDEAFARQMKYKAGIIK